MNKIWFLLWFGCVTIGHAEDAWKPIKDKQGIQLFSQQKPNHKLKHHQARVRINQDADTILAALQDTKACAEWVYNCISNQMVDMIDVSKRIFHTRIHSPLWFKDRDFYIESSVNYDPVLKIFTIHFTSQPEHAEINKDHVRISDIEMTWQLKYLAEDLTLVTYQVYIDPKLPIKAINHKMIQKSIFQTMLGLIRLVEKPIYGSYKYSDSELEMLSE